MGDLTAVCKPCTLKTSIIHLLFATSSRASLVIVPCQVFVLNQTTLVSHIVTVDRIRTTNISFLFPDLRF